MVVNWRKRGTEKHNRQGGESIQQPRRRPSGSRTEISAKFRRGTDIFRKSKLPCAARHGGESCSRWTASGAISGKARGKMHHLGAGTVKSGGGVYARAIKTGGALDNAAPLLYNEHVLGKHSR